MRLEIIRQNNSDTRFPLAQQCCLLFCCFAFNPSQPSYLEDHPDPRAAGHRLRDGFLVLEHCKSGRWGLNDSTKDKGGGQTMKRVTKEEEGIVGQMKAARHTSLVGRCVSVGGVVFPSEPTWRLLSFLGCSCCVAFQRLPAGPTWIQTPEVYSNTQALGIGNLQWSVCTRFNPTLDLVIWKKCGCLR